MFDLAQQTNTSYILPEFCLLGFPTYVSAQKHMYKDRDHQIDSYWQFSTSPLNSAFYSYVWCDRSQSFLLQKTCKSFPKLMWIIHILHCTAPRYKFSVDFECNILVTLFNTALIGAWLFIKSLWQSTLSGCLSFGKQKGKDTKSLLNYCTVMFYILGYLYFW